jgi:hypothetical protein
MFDIRRITANLAAAALFIAIAFRPAQSQSGCADAFTGPELDPAWTLLDADGEPGGAARILAGKLEISGKGSDAFKDVNEFVGVRRAGATGDFDVSVKIESQSNTHGWAQAGILAANDARQPSKGGYVIVDVTPANGYHAFYDAAGTQGTLDAHADAGVTAYPVWIRLARTGARFSAWYRNQAAGAWTPIAENFQALGTGPVSEIALVSLSHNDTAEAKAVFDDFTCRTTVAGVLPFGSGRSGFPPWAFETGVAGVDASGRPRDPRRARPVGLRSHSANTVLMLTNSRMPKWESSRP